MHKFKCSKCGIEKEEKDFYHNWVWRKKKTIKVLYRNTVCIECVKSDNQRRVKENPEKRKEQIKRDNARIEKKISHRKNSKRQRELGYYSDWQKRNPNKIKIGNQKHRDHDITKTEEESMLKVFNYSCAYCEMSLKEHKIKFGEKLHNDHVEHDGYNDLRNDVPACKSCNCSKWEHPMEEWFKEQSFFTEEKLDRIIWWTTEGYKDYIEDKLLYRIIRKQNEGLKTYHFELWSVDEKRNFIECLAVANKKAGLSQYIKLYFDMAN